MKQLAVTGNIGSGKTTVCKVFSALGIAVFNADEVAKELYQREDIKAQLKTKFGDYIFAADGQLDLAKYAQLIFTNKARLEEANQLVHPHVLEEYRQWSSDKQTMPYTIFESAIIFENNLQSLFDTIITVIADEDVRTKRVMERSGIQSKAVKERIRNQMDEKLKARQSDFVIDNNGKTALIPQIMHIHETLTSQ